MSDFSYQSYATYVFNVAGPSGPQFELQTQTNTPGTLADLDNDDTFETGDSITSPESRAYTNTVEIGGNDYPFFGNASDPTILVFFDDATVAPAVFFISDLTSQSYAFCFAAGTQIATPNGARSVEDLGIDDQILSSEGCILGVKWIGRQTVSTRFGPAERLMPVRFAAGSLGDGLLHTDLTVTADHGMLVDGVICHAGALVNGTTIRRVPLSEMGDSYTVFHIETEAHEIILANGAPAETFIDNVSRRSFDNYAEFEALYGDVPEMEELPYPRAMSARQVPEVIRQQLAAKRSA